MGDHNMYYNISFDIAAVLVLIVIAVGMKTVLYTDTPGHKNVLRYVYAVMACAIFDIITAYTISYGYMVPDGLNMVLNTLFQYSSVLCIMAAMQTIINYYPSASKTSVMVNRGLIIILIALLTLNAFTGILFSFKEGVYVHEPLYMSAYVMPLAIVFQMLYIVVKNRGDQPVVVSTIVVLFLFLPSVYTVIQMFIGNVLLVAFGEAFSALIMLFALETPDYRKLMRTLSDLDIARKEANTANRSKSDFLANMSHEIRTPLNGILGMNTMILNDSTDPRITEYAENIRVSGDALLSIINDILDVTKIESGKMEIKDEKYKLFSVLKECYQMNRFRAEEKGLEFVFEEDPRMPSAYFGDELRIRQIINNFVSNGIKYTEEGTVKLKADFINDGENEGTLIISVTDTGMGIKQEDLESLFDRFTRFDETKNRSIEGTGLGLYITQRLAKMMNGSIEVESEYGKGSVFTVKIPQRIADPAEIGEFEKRLKVHVSVSGSRKIVFEAPDKKVLVVDDTKSNIRVFTALLRDTKIRVESASSGFEAVDMTKNTKYDLIFMDHLMPKMNGVEAFHAIHDDEDNINHDTPVVVLTANAIVGMRESYLEEGFTEYLSKPVDRTELLATLERLLS